jgi:tellurite resistance protein
MKSFPVIPASFFGCILGVAGLGNGWRVAARLWSVPSMVGEVILLIGVVTWCLLIALYLGKWIWLRQEAMAELRHPVLCCFIGLVPLTAVLVAMAVGPYAHGVALGLFTLGAAGQLAFGLFRIGQLWQGGRDQNATTPVLYLPSVAGSFITSIGASALGAKGIAPMFFGAGLFSWLAIESVILHRLLMAEMMPKPLRLTLGIQLAPPVVGCIAYLGITSGLPDLFAQFLVGYGLFELALLLRLGRWFREQPFGAGYWAFSFGVTALAISLMRMADRGMETPYPTLALLSFVFSNVFIVWLSVSSLVAIARGSYVPPRLVPVSPA